jgi:acyl-[acyl-carrier-protein] desaturase
MAADGGYSYYRMIYYRGDRSPSPVARARQGRELAVWYKLRSNSQRPMNAKIEKQFFENFMKFFQQAEERRRWNIERDIPWDQVNRTTSESTAQMVESFSAVEMYLPDYTAKMLHMIRRSRGRAWFQANWGYEESKHSLTLDRWLIASGNRTPEQMEAFADQLLGEEWELPFDHPRQMIIYTMIQELATWLNYKKLRERAQREGDGALMKALQLISRDEAVHYDFFRKGVKLFMEYEPAETVRDLAYVFDHFQMPARYQIPDYEERIRLIAEEGIYTARDYVKHVKRPILEDLGLEKHFEKSLPSREEVPSILTDPMADTPIQRIAGVDPEEVQARKQEVARNGGRPHPEPAVSGD